jgi:hypothetical protein
MIVLSDKLRTLMASMPIPKDLRHLPPNGMLQFVLFITPQFLEILPDFSDSQQWSKFRLLVSERINALKIKDAYFSLCEKPELQIYMFSKLPFSNEVQELILELSEELGYADLMSQKLSEVDPERFANFSERVIRHVIDSFGGIDFDDLLQRGREYWNGTYPTLSPEERLKAETEAQYTACVFFSMIHNALSVVANRESLSTLLQRALSDSVNADEAMIRVVRVDNTFRQHPQFMARYLKACEEADSKFLNGFNKLSPPVTGKILYPGLYFLFSLLDDMGLLDKLTHPQILELCDHARLDRWESRIEDANYLGRRLKEYTNRRVIK